MERSQNEMAPVTWIRRGKYRFHDHDKLAHYANAATDIEYRFPFGFKELEGIHSRTDYDLGHHQKYSGNKIQELHRKGGVIRPGHVIETSIGVYNVPAGYGRIILGRGTEKGRRFFRYPRCTEAACLPCSRQACRDAPCQEGRVLPEIAEKIVHNLKFEFNCQYDDKDSIIRRYRRRTQ